MKQKELLDEKNVKKENVLKEKKMYEPPKCESKSPLNHVSTTYYYYYYTYTYIW
ncbi:hypothetical protein MTBBW1_60014 [Desulfamplus magnetovallimortis]|uniref:Uncharacterized protein n=1 Tax=Desulfamplus magnetovallimortis TaxID=1246637 RepID=A0A1W1HI14_9BACT|nr:hypothetical protein [Desulfamplus magnetovallimortis]SLM32114.1 hypothetical protein MTBBW1_60014 [Desulfamplus magnetovallimortis]